MTILTVGIDLAKNVFAAHGRNEDGKAVLLRPAVPRAKLLELIASLEPCVIAMQACSGAHHWARQFAKFAHTVRLIAPKFVTPHRRTGRRGKNDAADAAAICEAATRPDMLFVPVKSEEQRQQRMVHRACQGFIEARTATIDHIRGLLSAFGVRHRAAAEGEHGAPPGSPASGGPAWPRQHRHRRLAQCQWSSNNPRGGKSGDP